MAFVIGIVYSRDNNWIAGSYYIENLILALASLDAELPTLKIYSFSKDHFDALKQKTRYPSLTWVPLKDQNTILDKLINKITYTLLKRHWIVRGIDNEVDILFPASDTFFFDNIRTKLFWIPDFQERHFPSFFSTAELLKRAQFQRQLVKQNWPVIFSSYHAQSDFKELYPGALNQTFVIPFAVTLGRNSGINVNALKEKYGIEGSFFICSNQFWKHKNHLVVLKAILELKRRNKDVCVVFTGMANDPRNPGYYEEIQKFVEGNNLESNAKFLGFIDRQEQITLMENSEAIIQPSLFEGWSTVVEDAKALSHSIFVSDIKVHREQLGDNFENYFQPDDSLRLAELMSNPLKKIYDYGDYKENITSFARNMLRSMKSLRPIK